MLVYKFSFDLAPHVIFLNFHMCYICTNGNDFRRYLKEMQAKQAYLKVRNTYFRLTRRLELLLSSSHNYFPSRPIFFRRSTSASTAGPPKEEMKLFLHLIALVTAVIFLHPVVAQQAPQSAPAASAASLIT